MQISGRGVVDELQVEEIHVVALGEYHDQDNASNEAGEHPEDMQQQDEEKVTRAEGSVLL